MQITWQHAASEGSMEEERKELLMQVDGMTSESSAQAVANAIKRLDPGAEIEADVAHGRVAVTTRAQSLEVAEVINQAGIGARAMSL